MWLVYAPLTSIGSRKHVKVAIWCTVHVYVLSLSRQIVPHSRAMVLAISEPKNILQMYGKYCVYTKYWCSAILVTLCTHVELITSDQKLEDVMVSSVFFMSYEWFRIPLCSASVSHPAVQCSSCRYLFIFPKDENILPR